jgi:hypothetical protein
MAGSNDTFVGDYRHDAQGRRIVRAVTEDAALGLGVAAGRGVRASDGVEELVFDGLATTVDISALTAADAALDVRADALETGKASLAEDNTLTGKQSINRDGQAITSNGFMPYTPADSQQHLHWVIGAHPTGGINGRDGDDDDITNDAACGAGSAFFASLYMNSIIGDEGGKGSFAHIWSQVEVDDNGVDAYREGLAFFGTVSSNSKGALTTGIEVGNTIAAGKPGRCTAGNFAVSEANTLADYTTAMGAASAWAETGSRALNVVSNGAQPAGVGAYMYGDFLKGLWVDASNGDRELLRGSVAGEVQPRFVSSIGGYLFWGEGGAFGVDTSLGRVQTNVLKLQSALQLNPIAAGFMPIETLFIDPATSKLSYKDGAGVVNVLY